MSRIKGLYHFLFKVPFEFGFGNWSGISLVLVNGIDGGLELVLEIGEAGQNFIESMRSKSA